MQLDFYALAFECDFSSIFLHNILIRNFTTISSNSSFFHSVCFMVNNERVLKTKPSEQRKVQFWQYCLAGSSKTAPWILIFFGCPRCQIFILCEIHCNLCPPKIWHNNTFLGSVRLYNIINKYYWSHD